MPDDGRRRELERARAALARSRRAVARLLAEVAARSAAVDDLARRYGPGHARVRRAVAARDRARERLERARAAQRAAEARLAAALARWLERDPAEEIAALGTDFPLVLFPVRLETRFDPVGNPERLKIRIYPDEILADAHDPRLTAAERDAGLAYWQAVHDPDGEEEDARRRLLARFSAARAAWIVRATTPTLLATGRLRFPAVEARRDSWTRAEAPTLPDRWFVLAYREGALVRRAVSRPVAEPLPLTSNPNPDPADTVDPGDAGPPLDAGVAWTFDFERAERLGMAVTLPLEPVDVARGFDRLLVVGVKSSLTPEQGGQRLTELLEAHRYTRGLALVPQGTPTNNTGGGPAGFPPPDNPATNPLALEREPPAIDSESDGPLFATALGIPSDDLVGRLAGAGRTEQQAARAMNDALWPVTLGYFMEQMMAPVFDRRAIDGARRHFVEHVRGRGPLPAFRVGATPYGLLPVSSLTRWEPRARAAGPDRHLPRALRALRESWVARVSEVPRIGRGADPDGDLLAVLGMDASAREVRVRYALGEDLLLNLYQLVGTGFSGLDWAVWSAEQRGIVDDVLRRIGEPAWDPRANRAAWQPRIGGMAFADQAFLFRHPLVTSAPLSEERGVEPNYIAWAGNAPIVDLRAHRGGIDAAPPLLYLLLRQAMLLEYARVALDILVGAGLAQEEARRESELIDIPLAGRPPQPPIWERFDRQDVPLTAGAPLGEYVATAPVGAPRTGPLHDYRASLRTLESLPTAELERLFSETLDLCSHRLDAWVTSLAGKRLGELRAKQPAGSHLGAFGWVEDLRPAPSDRYDERTLDDRRVVLVQTTSGGYVHAPSLTHAAAAAILRNGHLTRAGDDRARYAVDLSSARVRTARGILDALRGGQPLAAVLGYRVERGLHERQLDQHVDPLRNRFPLVAGKGQAASDGQAEAADLVAARNVVDGLALRTAWHAKADPFPDSAPMRADLEPEVGALDEAIDAVADLLTAESVYQITRGNMAGAAAGLDALARGVRPPDPEIAHLPRGGTTLTHRVAVVLGQPPIPVSAPWPAATPRAVAEPYLDGWVGSLLGDPTRVRCRVSYLDPTPADPDRRTPLPDVTLADLRLRPLDVLALARGESPTAQASELDRRVADVALAAAPEGVEPRIAYAADPAWDRDRWRTFPEILELARAINAAIGGARPLRPEDLLPPEAAATVRDADRLGDEALRRADAALAALEGTKKDLDDAIAPPIVIRPPGRRPPVVLPPVERPEVPAARRARTLRTALREAARFGLAGAIPASAKGVSDADYQALLDQARSVREELGRRIAEATRLREELREEIDAARNARPPTDVPAATKLRVATEIVRAVFGSDTVFVPRFTPPNRPELARAVAAQPTVVGGTAPERANAIRQWLQQAARVRPPLERWRTLSLYAEALDADPAPIDVAQIPHVAGVRWVALPVESDRERPPSGRVSLVLHRPVVPGPSSTWAGLLLDEWSELIPSETELTGVTFHYDNPGAEAPQAVLIAVPPTEAVGWDLDTLVDILHETLDLAKLRAVDGELLGAFAQLLPAIYPAANRDGDAIATDFARLRCGDPRISP